MTDIYDSSKYIKILNNQLDLMKSKIEARLNFGCGGGIFRATPDTLLFVKLLIDEGHKENIVLLDKNSLPIKIYNLQEFYDQLLGRYTEVVNEAFSEYSKITKARTVEKLINE